MEHNPLFKTQFLQYVLGLPLGWIGQCEDIRAVWRGVQPSHPNAWGACWRGCKELGLLVELDREEHMKSIKSNGRKTHLHRRVYAPPREPRPIKTRKRKPK
jgi:hypothetical protein